MIRTLNALNCTSTNYVITAGFEIDRLCVSQFSCFHLVVVYCSEGHHLVYLQSLGPFAMRRVGFESNETGGDSKQLSTHRGESRKH